MAAHRAPSKRILQLAARMRASTTVRFEILRDTAPGAPVASYTVELPLQELLEVKASPGELGRAVEAWLDQVDKDLEHLEQHQVKHLAGGMSADDIETLNSGARGAAAAAEQRRKEAR